MSIIKSVKDLNIFDKLLWLLSVAVVLISYILSGKSDILSMLSALLGVTALIFLAKGDIWGQVLTIVFSILYAIVSYEQRYYGEMITYMCMTAPMAFLSLYSWLKNPFEHGKNEVEIADLSKKDICYMFIFSVIITLIFFFILKYFNNASLYISTLSIFTSFLASYLTFLRSSYYALAYAVNDIVLIVLWIIASRTDLSYLPMVACFIMFFINDLYGFFNWINMHKRQKKSNII